MTSCGETVMAKGRTPVSHWRARAPRRPQWILPFGGQVTVHGVAKRLTADYS